MASFMVVIKKSLIIPVSELINDWPQLFTGKANANQLVPKFIGEMVSLNRSVPGGMAQNVLVL